MPRDELLILELSEWLLMRAHEQPGRFAFLTLTYDRYRKYYLPQGSASNVSPSSHEVLSGLALPMPPSDAKAALIADLNMFYSFLLRELFGSHYDRHFERQPVGIGALDEPRYKGVNKRSPLARKVGDAFAHAHFVLFSRSSKPGSFSGKVSIDFN